MNKKIFKSLFMGALLVGSVGTLTSCSKDYDNDINDLKTQIAQLETLSTTVSSLQTAVTTATTTANDALTKAKAAATETELTKAVSDFNTAIAGKADQTALDAAVSKLTTLGADVAALKTALAAYPTTTHVDSLLAAKADTAVVNALDKRLKAVEALNANLSQLSSDVAGMKIDVANLKLSSDAATAAVTKLEGEYEALNSITTGILGQVSKMVTDVDLWTGATNRFNGTLRFYSYTEKETTFGPNGEVVFTKDKVSSTQASMLIRVSPTTATLDPDSISLMNSQNEAITGKYLDVVSCEPYTELITSRYNKTSANGLWEVTFKLKDNIDLDAFEKACMTTVNGKDAFVNFCVAVKSGLTGENRAVVSAYALRVMAEPAEDANYLSYYVDDTNVWNIHNRYAFCEKEGTSTENVSELTWKGDADIAANISTSNTLDKPENGDNRQYAPLALAQVNKDITITFDEPVRAFYVTLDKGNALESKPSELNAWNSYKYTNLNKVFESKSGIAEGTIQINSSEANGDNIGFRVYAVNFDGTLIDPDGRAFYVTVGNDKTISSYTASVDSVGLTTTDAISTVNSAWSPVLSSGTFTDASDVAYGTIVADENNVTTTPAGSFVVNCYTATSDKVIMSAANSNALTRGSMTSVNLSGEPSSKIARVRLGMLNPANFTDGATYKYTVTLYSGDGSVLHIFNLSLTKSELTSAIKSNRTSAFAAKANQLVDNVFKAYMTPNNVTTATSGTIKLNNAFDGLWTNTTTSVPLDKNFTFTFGNDDNDASVLMDNYTDATSRSYTCTVSSKYIDNTTIYPTTVSYNYKNYSSNGTNDYVEVASFKTIFCCIFDSSVSTFTWGTEPKLQYAKTGVTAAMKDISIANTYNNTLYSGVLSDFLGLADLSTKYLGGLTIDANSAHLYTTAGMVEDQYFAVSVANNTLTFSPNPSATVNPTADVPSTLVFTCTDSFGHKVTVSLKMTVAKQ